MSDSALPEYLYVTVTTALQVIAMSDAFPGVVFEVRSHDLGDWDVNNHVLYPCMVRFKTSSVLGRSAS